MVKIYYKTTVFPSKFSIIYNFWYSISNLLLKTIERIMKIEIIKEDINFGGIVSEINITEDLNDTIINELDKK